jgi:hypothetical protein
MLFAFLTFEPDPLTVADVVGAGIKILLPMAILAAMLFTALFHHRGAKPVMTSLAVGAVLGTLLGSTYACWPLFPQSQGFPSGEVHPSEGGAMLPGNAVRRRWISRVNLVRTRCNHVTEGVRAQPRHLARERLAWTRRLAWPIASGEAAILPGAQRGASAGARTHYASTRTCRCADACTSP